MGLEMGMIKRGWALVATDGSITASDGGCFTTAVVDDTSRFTFTLSPKCDPSYHSVSVTIRDGTDTHVSSNAQITWADATTLRVQTYQGAAGVTKVALAFEITVLEVRPN